MRLIDADKFIEYCRNGLADMEEALKAEPPIKELNRYALAEMQTAMFIRDINEQPTVKEWIPAKRELPKDYKKVLIKDADGDVYIARHINGNWDCCYFAYDYEDVIAWMPIPEYKGDKND